MERLLYGKRPNNRIRSQFDPDAGIERPFETERRQLGDRRGRADPSRPRR
jgi:hypothetical protein